MDIDRLKSRVIADINANCDLLIELSARIHDNPELGFQETKVSGWLIQHLEENGFNVERNYCDLPTAFKASYGLGKPTIAVLAEYDALPQIGHACGHNLIAASAIGAGTASKPAITKYGGSIIIIGTPAEELYGGKAIIADRGGFDKLDIAMMVHPGTSDTAITNALACQSLEIEFFGKAAHAAAHPEKGINALEAMLLSFAAINALRQHIKDKTRIHGIITNGGEAANIVPAHSSASFLLRAKDNTLLEELKVAVLNCFIGAATATGARLEYNWAKVCYAPMRNSKKLARIFRENMRHLGRKMSLSTPSHVFGSTDMGNVSQLIPSIHSFFAIAPPQVLIHSPEFAQAVISDTANKGLLDAAKAMAMTVVDLVSNPELIAEIKKDFQQ